MRARRLKLTRDKGISKGKSWSHEDKEKLKAYYDSGITRAEIAKKLGRSVVAITAKIQGMIDRFSGRPRKRKVDRESSNLISLQESPSRGGHRG